MTATAPIKDEHRAAARAIDEARARYAAANAINGATPSLGQSPLTTADQRT